MPTDQVLVFPSEPRRTAGAPDYDAEEQTAGDAYIAYLLGLADTALRNTSTENEHTPLSAVAA